MKNDSLVLIKPYFALLVFFFWLGLPNFYFAINHPDSLLKDFSIYFSFVSCVLFFVKQAKNIFLLFFIPALLVPYECFYIYSFGRVSDAHLFGILSESHSQEIYGYISGLEVLFAALFMVTIASLIVIATQMWGLTLSLSFRVRCYLLMGALSITTIPSVFVVLGDLAVQNAHPKSIFSQENLLGAEIVEDCILYRADSALSRSYPVGLFTRLYCFGHDRAALNKIKKLTQNFTFSAFDSKPSRHRKIHILVIGETGRPSRWQLFGYGRETNPMLRQQKNLVLFSNVVTPWAWTRMSVPIIITRKNGRDKNPVFAEKSLLQAFNEAGFNTVWLSNQSATGFHDASTTLYAAEAKQVLFINPTAYYGSGSYDGELLLPLEKILTANTKDDMFIVLHTLGSHFNYADRYPKAFKKFSPSLEDVKKVSLHDKLLKDNLSNSYDNSVLYTDFFLNAVIAQLKKQDAITSLFYVADHGENLFDGTCKQSGHGRGNEWDHLVPMLWWYSDEYQRFSPDALGFAQHNQHKKLTTENIFHSYLDMVGISYPKQDLSMSFFNSQFKERPRYVNATTTLDFDMATRTGDCKTLSIPFPKAH